MIQQTHLTAPWPRRSQIEQDLRLSRGVAALFADPVLVKAVDAFTWYLEKEGARLGGDEANALLDIRSTKSGTSTDYPANLWVPDFCFFLPAIFH